MKKIDLHIHTIPTISDTHYDFDVSKLEEYVKKLEIDCIAITNHNIFDLNQYNDICNTLDIEVYPGIEIDIEKGHLLLISDKNDLLNFSEKCKNVTNLIHTKDDYISIEQFKNIFPSLDEYILIPHYKKDPALNPIIIDNLNTLVSAGEVSSIKKFISCIKTPNNLVPVIFSDSRYYPELKNFSTKQTFIDLEEITFTGIKYCLTDKQKVFLSKDEGNNFFQVTDNGLRLSTGLNVILGERSTGKTYTLNKIFSSFDNVKYIKQFSLLQDDEGKFKELLSRRNSNISESYLEDFKNVLSNVKNIDIRQNNADLDKYLNSLLKFASESERKDVYSKTKLFSENLFSITNLSNLKKLIDATITLKENTEYKTIINKHINEATLLALEIDLIKEYLTVEEENLKKTWINTLILNVKNKLSFHTSSTIPEDVDFYNILLENEKVKIFNRIVDNLKEEKQIDSKEIRNFKIVATKKKFTSVSQLQKIHKRKIALSDTFKKYNIPYSYLRELRNLDIEETELHTELKFNFWPDLRQLFSQNIKFAA